MPPDRSPRSLVHQLESPMPLKVLEAVRELRAYLDSTEADALCDARDAGASITHIAEAVGATRQTVYNKLKQLRDEKQAREADEQTVLVPELAPELDG